MAAMYQSRGRVCQSTLHRSSGTVALRDEGLGQAGVMLIDAARPRRHAPGERWFVDETYIKATRRWVYLYRAIDQFGQVIDVLIAQQRDLAASRRFFARELEHGTRPTEVTTDRAATTLGCSMRCYQPPAMSSSSMRIVPSELITDG